MCVLVNLPLDLSQLGSFLPSFLTSFEERRAEFLRLAGAKSLMESAGELRIPRSDRRWLDAPLLFSRPTAPELDQVDVILVTDAAGLLGVPLLGACDAPIYATEPTVEFARQMMEELIEFAQCTTRPPEDADVALGAHPQLQRLFTKADMERVLARVTPVTFREQTVRQKRESAASGWHADARNARAAAGVGRDCRGMQCGELAWRVQLDSSNRHGKDCCHVCSVGSFAPPGTPGRCQLERCRRPCWRMPGDLTSQAVFVVHQRHLRRHSYASLPRRSARHAP